MYAALLRLDGSHTHALKTQVGVSRSADGEVNMVDNTVFTSDRILISELTQQYTSQCSGTVRDQLEYSVGCEFKPEIHHQQPERL